MGQAKSLIKNSFFSKKQDNSPKQENIQQQYQQQQQQMPYFQQQTYPSNKYSSNIKQASNRNQMEKKIYDDDEKIDVKEFVKKINNNNKKKYDINENIQLKIKSLQKSIKMNSKQDQTVPVMVSLKTLDIPQVEEEKKDLEDNSRPGIDLVCVIDISGSMQGQKIELVKQALTQLLVFLNENDRLSIILFESHAERLFGLKRISQENIQSIKNQIQQIASRGGTDINSGMNLAFKTLKDRKYKNQVSSIFLLSDGLDSDAQKRVEVTLKEYNISDTYTIHSFGFGADHDPVLMSDIAKLKDGSFYYIEKLDVVDECFVNALGGLFSVIAQNVTLEIKPINQKPFSDITIKKTFGELWKFDKKNALYTINIPQLFCGISKDFLLELDIPKLSFQLDDLQRNPEILEVTMTAYGIEEENNKSPIQKKLKLIITFYNENENIPEIEQDIDVLQNYFRVKGAEVIESARNFADQGKYEQGQQLLDGMVQQINNNKKIDQQKVQSLKNDLTEAKEFCSQSNFNQGGKIQMISYQRGHQEQKAYKQQDIYANMGQERFVTKMQKMKKS